MQSHALRMRRWILIPVALAVLAVTGLGVQQSVAVRANWKVLPYQTLRLSGSEDRIDVTDLEIPEPSPLDVSRGYLEIEHAVRLHVISNTPWKLQITGSGLPESMASLLRIRRHGDTYSTVSDQPRVLASGTHGAFEISIDVRVWADSDGIFPTGSPVNLVYTLMSN